MKNIFYVLLNKFNVDVKISMKIIVFTMLISMFPLIFLSGVFNNEMQDYYNEKLDQTYEQVVNQYVSNINYKLDIYQTFLANISFNQNIFDLVKNKDKYNSSQIYDIGKKVSKEVGVLIKARNNKELRNIMVYLYDESVAIYSLKVINVKKEQEQYWYKKLQENMDKGYMVYKINSSKYDVLSLTKQLVETRDEHYGDKIGFVKLDLNTYDFFNIKDYSANSQKNIYIIDEDGEVIWGNQNKDISFLKSNTIEDIMHDRPVLEVQDANGIKKRILYKNINEYGWKVIFLFDHYGMDRNIIELRRAMITYLVIATMIMILLTILFSRKFSKRIDLIISKMIKVEKGDLSISEIIEGTDEIGTLDEHFNMMVYKLKDLINSNYVQKLEKREAELKALQFQINPHFLYNTLESINSLAAVNECYEICEISYKLGEMFRYSINKDTSEYVTLEDELNHIKNYIYIQKIRFKDKFEVFYNIDKYASRSRVLKFILQPIIENAIIHGFENTSGCIEISSYVADNRLYIKISDDGIGMSKEQVKDINNKINQNDMLLDGYKQSIGIKNVNTRIKLFCGEQYGIKFISEFNIGTEVIIVLPANLDS